VKGLHRACGAIGWLSHKCMELSEGKGDLLIREAPHSHLRGSAEKVGNFGQFDPTKLQPSHSCIAAIRYRTKLDSTARNHGTIKRSIEAEVHHFPS